MTSREGLNRNRLRQATPNVDQVLTPLGRVASTIPSGSTSVPTTVVQNSGNIRQHYTLHMSLTDDVETNSNSIVILGTFDTSIQTPIITFDAEQFRSDIKTHGNDEKRLEQLIINAINYFIAASKRAPQQVVDYTVLTFLAWTASLHGEIFRLPSILKAMCTLLKGSALTKIMKTFPTINNGNNLGLTTTPYTLVCQIFWIAFKDQTHWPDEFIEAYVEDALGEQNWIKNPDCRLFVSNIQTAFNTRPCSWKLDGFKLYPALPISTSTTITAQISSTLNDETSNDSNNNNESLALPATESESSMQTMDDSILNNNNNNNNTDIQLILSRYEKRSQQIQNLLQSLLTTNAKIKSTIGNSTNLNTNASITTPAGTSQPHETDKLLYLLEQLCGLSDIRLHILSRLDIWLQNPKLNRTAEKLMVTLCENLTKPTTMNNHHHHQLTNGHSINNDLSYIDERAIEQLVNLRFKVRASNATSKMYILCIREMVKIDANLVDIIVRFIVHNELQQISISLAVLSQTTKNPNNLSLLHACCQSQPEHTCQSLANSIQNILLLTNVTTTSKDYDSLLKLIRPFIRDFMRYAKNEFDSMRFCMYLIDMHYSNNLQQQFWTMVQQQDPPSNEISSNRLLKRLLECDMSTRERFLYAICDIIPMIILASAQAFNSTNNTINPNAPTTRLIAPINNEQWLLFIQRISFIQCSSCLFFLYTLPRLFDSTSSINPINYVTCLYSILFTAQVNSYLRIENWPPEEPLGLRNDLFRLSSEIPLLGETLYLLIQIGLTPQFRINPSIIVDLIDLIVRRTLNVEQKMPNDYASLYLRLPENRSEIFLKKFFDLTRYHIPIQIQFPSTYQIPKNLFITEIFWKSCLICLLLASHDPQMFGRFIWTSVPQIRLFMEMLLTGDYTYPPKSMIETKDFLEKFYANERLQLREEKDSILELEKYLASPKIIDETNSQLLGKIILLDLQQIKRPATHEKNEKNFYNLIQGFNNLYKLSSMLCRCRSPDFILNVLNRKEQQGKNAFDSQTSWLTSLIDSNIDCLNVFPIICLCDYFQHMIMIYNAKSILNPPSKKTLHALETILIRFKSIIQAVKQQILSNTQKSTLNSPQIDDMTCILNYFFNCLNSNISTVRTNAWLCLYIILNDNDQIQNIENLLSKFDQLPETYIELILSTITQFKSLDQTQLLVKQTLSETCHFETNIYILHCSTMYIIDNCHIDSNNDISLLSNLARALNRRHSILYLLIQYDRQEKNSKLIENFFHFIIIMLMKKIEYSLKHPIDINSDENYDEKFSTNTQTYLMLPGLNSEQINIIKQLENHVNLKDDYKWSTNMNKHYIQIDSVLIELLLIFLAYFDFNNSKLKALADSASLLQQFFLNIKSTPCFTTIKQFNPPVPVKQSQDENQSVDDSDDDHFKQFAIEDIDPPEHTRKRRRSHTNSAEKVFVASSTKPIYRIVPINNENEQSLFLSDDLQYFIFKSNNFSLVKRCIDQASLSTCLKMFKISVTSHENVNCLCQRLNQLIDLSSKQIHTYIKQSSFILPLINRWIIEQLPEAIKLGEKLKKLSEKKKKSHSATQEKSSDKSVRLIPTSSRMSSSIVEQIHSFDIRINDLCNKKSSDEISNDNQMDTSDTEFNIPWKNLDECEELLKYLIDKKTSQIKRRQLLVQLQWLTNMSEDYCFQLCQTMLKCCYSTYKHEFINNLNQQFNCSFALLSILMKSKLLNNDFVKLLNLLESDCNSNQSLVLMKIKQLKRVTNQLEELKLTTKSNVNLLPDEQIKQNLTIDHMLNIFISSNSLNDWRIEQQFYKYFKSNNEHEDECKHLLINVLVEAEYKLSEPTIGMILDQLERIDYKSPRSSNTSIYANHLLFFQRTDSSISQRLLLKKFLHSCDWSTILNCIYDLLTLNSSNSKPRLSVGHLNFEHNRLLPTHPLKQSHSSLLNHRDSTLILDMLEAFIKLSPLWSGREFKMLDRCHDELLIDLNEQHIYTLIICILDEGYRRYLSQENLYEQYQKRYETIIYYLIKNSDKKSLFQYCLQKIFIDSDTILWIKNILTSFYFIIYINQSDLFNENFYLILPNLFSEIKQQYKKINFINTNYDYIIHDLLIRLNSYDLISIENFYEINLLLKQYVSKYPILFLRHLNVLKLDLQSRLSTLTYEEVNRRNSKQRTLFHSLFDLIYRLKPYIYDQIYENDFQSIIDIYIRLVQINLSVLNTCTKQNMLTFTSLHDLIYLIDRLLSLMYDYLYSTINNNQHNSLFKTYHIKFFEKINEKIQTNKELYQYLASNKHNQILYHLKQLKILYEAIKSYEIPDLTNTMLNEIVPFNVRLCLVDGTLSDNNSSKQSISDSSIRHKSLDIQYYRMKLSISIDEYTSSMIIDDVLLTLNDLKSHIDHYLPIDHIELILDSLTNYLLNGNKQLIEQTYEFILKYIEKYPQYSLIFYSAYIKCILSTNLIVFQMALEHFSHFIIYFQSKANELFNILLKQGLINKTDVTTSITQAIRLLNLHRYDPITYTNLTSAMSSKIAIATTTTTTTTND
ncbi:unnamed protein product [Rotaria magnacalcarata]|uniref:Uncharacterized protein n=14 Tax=Rotaria magnacalcarata TaxID=392030 RepID=A0A815D1Z1_9BILA|nr:unnamed protein product [Rotaria magnacalcarata]